jgi:hypothetical protein
MRIREAVMVVMMTHVSKQPEVQQPEKEPSNEDEGQDKASLLT